MDWKVVGKGRTWESSSGDSLNSDQDGGSGGGKEWSDFRYSEVKANKVS